MICPPRAVKLIWERAVAKTGKPNILFILADDIGWFNVSAYNLGVMGYRTPNIDKIGREGAIFTDLLPIRTEEPEYENYPKDQID